MYVHDTDTQTHTQTQTDTHAHTQTHIQSLHQKDRSFLWNAVMDKLAVLKSYPVLFRDPRSSLVVNARSSIPPVCYSAILGRYFVIPDHYSTILDRYSAILGKLTIHYNERYILLHITG